MESVVINRGIPKFLPKFENPLYKIAMEQKMKLRGEILERIKSGTHELAPLLENVLPLTKNELEDVISSWLSANNYDLFNYYLDAIINCDIVKIKVIDKYFKEKYEENIGRR